MMTFAITFAMGCFSIGLLCCLVRVMKGPHMGDRVLALDTMVINAIALMLLYGILHGTEVYFESVVIIAMLGFVSTVAYARFILRGNIIE